MGTPYIGFGNDTLSRLPPARPGDKICCPTCKQEHELIGGDDGSTIVLFYRCGGESFIGAVSGRLTVGTRADVRGEI